MEDRYMFAHYTSDQRAFRAARAEIFDLARRARPVHVKRRRGDRRRGVLITIIQVHRRVDVAPVEDPVPVDAGAHEHVPVPAGQALGDHGAAVEPEHGLRAHHDAAALAQLPPEEVHLPEVVDHHAVARAGLDVFEAAARGQLGEQLRRVAVVDVR